MSLEEALSHLASHGGLLGLSDNSGDIRDLESAAATGDEKSQLALDVYIQEIRRHLGGMIVALGGVDAIVFTGGIGEKGAAIRVGVCADLQELGIVLDPNANHAVSGEVTIHSEESRTQLWVIPTNEEVIVARQCVDLLKS